MESKSTFIIIVFSLISFTTGQYYRRERSCENLNSPGKEYLLDPDYQRCYLVGSRGPCGELMTFYENPLRQNSKSGFCDCDQGHVDKSSPCKDSPIRRRFYDPRADRCYTVFSQGPCNEGYWLVLNLAETAGACVPNRCLTQGKSRDTDDQFWFYDINRRQCYKTYSQGYCPRGMQLELIHDSQYPICKAPTCSGSVAYGIRSSVTCKPGSRFSYLTNSCRIGFNRTRGSSAIG